MKVPPPPKIAEQTPPPPESAPTDEKTEPTMKTPSPPTDLPLVDQPTADQIALSAKPVMPAPAAPPVDRPAATPQPVATPPPAEQMAKLTTPAPRVNPQPRRESGYQPDQEANRIEGSITNRGRPAVDSIATPMGKFKKRVNDSIGSRWQMYVKDPRRMPLFALGSTRVSFFITSQGRVQSIKIDANSSNQSFADICVAAISDAQRNDTEIFQPPPGALDAMRDGRLEYTITFTLYSY
jgi:outer membrane biosynthesis protein TonB